MFIAQQLCLIILPIRHPMSRNYTTALHSERGQLLFCGISGESIFSYAVRRMTKVGDNFTETMLTYIKEHPDKNITGQF